MPNTVKWQVEFEMNQQGKIINVSKISGGDGGKPPDHPTPPHSDVVIMMATKHSPGHLCFWINNQWICF